MPKSTPRQAQGSSHRERSWLPLSVLALGLGSLVTMLGADYLRHRSIVRDEARLLAACELRVEVTLGHLWLEEYVTGDEVHAEAAEHSGRALDLVAALLYGGSPQATGSPVAALEDPRLNRQALELRSQLEIFDEVSRERWEGFGVGLDVGIGSAIDRSYDDVFREVLDQTTALEGELERQMAANKERSKTVFVAILALWGGVVIAAAFGLWTRERHRLAAEAALRLREAELQRSQKMDALGRLAGGVAHDINNYLAAIRGQCELVQMKLPPEDRTARKMAAAVRTITKASKLVERLLAFGRRQPVEPEVVNLNHLIRGLEKMMRPSIGEKIRLETRLASVLWNVEIDPGQFEQVLVNLMVNARDAMPGGGTITLETYNLPSNAGAGVGEVVVKVRDTGCGIAAGEREKIFEPFWTSKAQGGGSGLGLAIVYRIVAQAGGTLDLASEPGVGTEFALYLPRCQKPLTAGRDASALPDDAPLGTESLLLVDDNRDFREATRALLRALGYEVQAASSGEEAIALFERTGRVFDLVVTDVVMPGMNGPEMVERLEERGLLRVLFISGYTEDVALQHGFDLQRAHFLKKPFSSLELARAVRDLLDRVILPEAGYRGSDDRARPS